MSLGEKKPKPNSRCRIKRRGGSCDCGRYGKKPVKAPYYSTVENEPEFLKRVVKWKRLNERRKHKKKGGVGLRCIVFLALLPILLLPKNG